MSGDNFADNPYELARLRAEAAPYIAVLVQGAHTHATYSGICGEQIAETLRHLESRREMVPEPDRDGDVFLEQIAARIGILELQQTMNAVGLTVCMAGLAICAALGQVVPDPPLGQPSQA